MMSSPGNITSNFWLLCRNLKTPISLQSCSLHTLYKQRTVSARRRQLSIKLNSMVLLGSSENAGINVQSLSKQATEWTVMNDALSEKYHEPLLPALSELKDTNFIADLFSAYLLQAVDRVCTASTTVNKAKFNEAPWFDRECRDKRPIAIKAGHWV